ncbi:hypothetical protein Nepgr_027680 [Nepenthes gracilis]|uniref:SWIM-type domain-containing protein n=1 Tax=Nepenthes gracilis TaxID=150966 RepID=A0AAD3TAI4_NEPGR|nr:hypothetical protein Nepgr_027680 [Nepenthes gracilis]
MDDCILSVGMEFDSMDAAWDFWKEYGKRMGFGVRKNFLRRSKIDDVEIYRMFTCAKEGQRRINKKRGENSMERWETRCGCEAMLEVVLVREKMKVVVKAFILEHNHELEPPKIRHFLISQREVSAAQGQPNEIANDAGLRPSSTSDLTVMEAGGSRLVGYITEDQKSYLRTRRQRHMQHGEAGAILTYFQKKKMKNSGFFYELQLDSDDRITNIFWADVEMIIDYQYFGDAVMFDTTYRMDEGLRPFGAFTGFNHHRQIVVFGATLLYDKTVDSFAWLFDTFVRCHGGKAPITIFTDQDAAMDKALKLVMTSTRHGLCTWHILQNAIKHLVARSDLLSAFTSCMFSIIDKSDFDNAWASMVSNVGEPHVSTWLDGIYVLRHKWAYCYMKKTFSLSIRSMQLSESLNNDLKAYLKCSTNLRDFFHYFERIVEKKCEGELFADYKSKQKLPNLIMPNSPLMIQLAKIYTPTIFKMMQDEMVEAFAWRLVSRQGPEYILASHANPKLSVKVVFECETEVIECECRLMETNGILCAHVFKVFIIHDVTVMPDKYILSRWTRKARFHTPTLCSDRIILDEDSQTWAGRMMFKVMRNCLLVGRYPGAREKIEDCITKMDEIVQNLLNLYVDQGTTNVHIPEQFADESVKVVKNCDGWRTTQ